MIKLNRPPCPNPAALQTNYKHPENKRALIFASHDKCMYCESKVSATSYGDIEHIKPKSIFPDLEFNWENLGYACARCNGYKSDKHDAVNPIINPYDEDPETHLVALGAILVDKASSERGRITIQQDTGLHLNRPQLIEKRQEKINQIQKVITISSMLDSDDRAEILESLKPEAEVSKEFSLCIKTLLRANNVY